MLWLAIALVALIIEVLTGTFYLLVLCIAFAIVGAIQLIFHTNLEINLILIAVLSLIGLVSVRRYHKKNKQYFNDDQHKDNLNINQTVVISDILPSGELLIQYRGTQWQAILPAGQTPSPEMINKTAKIIDQQSNVFTIDLN